MSERPGVVRSYQRVFRPDRRIYAVDGRAIPVPGGVPLRWLAAATVVLVTGLLLAALSPVLIIGASAVAGWSVLRLGRHRLVAPAVAATSGGLVVTGVLLRSLDWPLRLVVLPAVVATVMTQLAPDGRGVHRFAWSWLRAQLAGRRRLGQPMAPTGERGGLQVCVRVASDWHRPVLRRAALIGPGCVRFCSPMMVRRTRRGWVVRPLDAERRPRGLMVDHLELADGERARVRP